MTYTGPGHLEAAGRKQSLSKIVQAERVEAARIREELFHPCQVETLVMERVSTPAGIVAI